MAKAHRWWVVQGAVQGDCIGSRRTADAPLHRDMPCNAKVEGADAKSLAPLLFQLALALSGWIQGFDSPTGYHKKTSEFQRF